MCNPWGERGFDVVFGEMSALIVADPLRLHLAVDGYCSDSCPGRSSSHSRDAGAQFISGSNEAHLMTFSNLSEVVNTLKRHPRRASSIACKEKCPKDSEATPSPRQCRNVHMPQTCPTIKESTREQREQTEETRKFV
jgi:hypothetical protein